MRRGMLAALVLLVWTGVGRASVDLPRLEIADRDLTVPLALGVAAFAVIPLQNADLAERSLEDSRVEFMMDVGDSYGDGRTLGLATLGLLAAGHFGDRRSGRVGRDFAKSLLTTWSVVWVLKVAVNAERPDGGRHAFPSGHTATAFAAAPVIRAHYGSGAGLLAYGASVFTALGRMEDRRHWASDVLMGAAIGITVGRFASPVAGEGAPRLRVGERGISLTMEF